MYGTDAVRRFCLNEEALLKFFWSGHYLSEVFLLLIIHRAENRFCNCLVEKLANHDMIFFFSFRISSLFFQDMHLIPVMYGHFMCGN